MNIVNQHTVWVVGLVANGATILSCAIAFIVNREKLLAFAKKYWWLISLPFVLLGLWSFYEFGVLGWTWHKLTNIATVGIPIWAILVAVLTIILIGFAWRWISERLKVKVGAQSRPLSPDDFRVEDYEDDTIDGVLWHWTYSGHTVNPPKPLCPNQNCQCDLSFREDWMRVADGPNVARIGAPPVTLHCPRCYFRMDFSKTAQNVLYDVTQEILSRIRTGRFRDILYNRAVNQELSQNH
jgi:hypothetical protein